MEPRRRPWIVRLVADCIFDLIVFHRRHASSWQVMDDLKKTSDFGRNRRAIERVGRVSSCSNRLNFGDVGADTGWTWVQVARNHAGTRVDTRILRPTRES